MSVHDLQNRNLILFNPRVCLTEALRLSEARAQEKQRALTWDIHADVPARVVISEYVDLADAFYGERETGLVNGVLDRLARELRPLELGTKHEPGKAAG